MGDHKTEMEWGDVLDLLREIVPTSFVLNGADNGLEFMYNQQTAKVFDLDYPGQHFPISIVRSNIEELSRVTNIPATPAKKSDFNVFKVIVEGAPAPNAFDATIHVRTTDASNFLIDNLKTHARTPNGEQVGLKVLSINRKKHKALGSTDDSTRTYVWYADVVAWSPDTSYDPLVVQFPEQDKPKTHILSSVTKPFNFTLPRRARGAGRAERGPPPPTLPWSLGGLRSSSRARAPRAPSSPPP